MQDPTADTTCGDCFIDCTEFGEVCGPEETCGELITFVCDDALPLMIPKHEST